LKELAFLMRIISFTERKRIFVSGQRELDLKMYIVQNQKYGIKLGHQLEEWIRLFP
jgi:hypothetical protein